MKQLKFTILVLVASLAFVSCEGLFGGNQIQAQKVFNLDLFEQNILGAYGDSVGFTYAIAQNGTLVRADGIGVGLTAEESGGERAMHEDQRMHIASISKTITTAAVLRLLEDTAGVGLDSSIEPYLPSSWTRGPGVGAISFRQLLSHKSGFFFGLVDVGETDNLLAEHIEDGNILQQEDPIYDNVHHALFRVIVPYVLGEEHTNSSETEAQFHSRVFANYVQDVVFTPAGVPANRATTTPPADSNRYYPWPYDGQPGEVATDFTLNFGAYGWYLSAVDLASVLSYLRFTEDIISGESRTIMNNERLGWWNTRSGDHGTYNMKQGGWRLTSTPVEKGMQSIAANLAAGVQAVVIINSRRDANATDPSLQPFDMASLMRDAFDDAFVSP